MSVKKAKNNDIFVSMKKQRCDFDLSNKIAQRIKELRMNKGISQDAFYIDTDIHIARIEAGRANITVSTLQDICNYFSISLTDFFSSIENPSEQ